MSADAASGRRLRDAAERGDIRAVAKEIAAGADVNDHSGGNWTALHRAADRGRVDVVRLLMQAGADHSLPTKMGQTTALELAANKGFVEVSRELMKWGADPPKGAQGTAPIYSTVTYVRPVSSTEKHPALFRRPLPHAFGAR
jgi:ankyrin repeat protein